MSSRAIPWKRATFWFFYANNPRPGNPRKNPERLFRYREPPSSDILFRMSTRKSSSRGDFSPDTNEKPFRMLAVYDSPEASREAAYASEFILRELGEDIEVDKTSWDLRSLETSSLRTLAAEEATRADVIVIALSAEEPTPFFKEWTDEWQCQRELANGLLALIPSGDSETGGNLADFLYETAVTAQMDFICRKKRRF